MTAQRALTSVIGSRYHMLSCPVENATMRQCIKAPKQARLLAEPIWISGPFLALKKAERRREDCRRHSPDDHGYHEVDDQGHHYDCDEVWHDPVLRGSQDDWKTHVEYVEPVNESKDR